MSRGPNEPGLFVLGDQLRGTKCPGTECVRDQMRSSPILNQEIPETCDKYESFNEPEKLGIFVKSERNIKPENSFDINDYDSNLALSTVSSDPLEIPVHERKSPIKIHDAALDIKKHSNAKHIIASTLKMNIVKVDPHEANNQSNDKCKFCLEFVEKIYMKEHLSINIALCEVSLLSKKV